MSSSKELSAAFSIGTLRANPALFHVSSLWTQPHLPVGLRYVQYMDDHPMHVRMTNDGKFFYSSWGT